MYYEATIDVVLLLSCMLLVDVYRIFRDELDVRPAYRKRAIVHRSAVQQFG